MRSSPSTTTLLHAPTMLSVLNLRIGALFFHFDHLSSFPLTSQYVLHEGPMEKWATIGGNFCGIDEREALEHFAGRGRDPSVLRAQPESLTGPDWWVDGKYYLAYGVDLRNVGERDGGVAGSWVHAWFGEEEDPDTKALRLELGWAEPKDEFLEPVHRQQVLPELAHKIKKDLGVAKDLVRLLDGQGVLVNVDVDVEYSGDALLQVAGQANVFVELRRARRAMDERLAAINYGLRRVEPRVRVYIELKYAAYIAEWRLFDHGRMRGIYLDFRTLDPVRVPIFDLLSHKVPIYYPIDAEFSPRLTEDETRALEAIRTPQEFAYLFKLACYPDIQKSLPMPQPTSSPSTPTLSDTVRTSKVQRRKQLYEYAEVALADLIHDPRIPITSPLDPVTVTSIESARLIVDPVTEARMVLWALQAGASTASDIIQEALRRGWPFQIAYPEVYLDQLRASEPDHWRDELGPLVVSTVSDNLSVQEAWVRFLKRVFILLSRPNAKAFLYLGGILWRLAILLGDGPDGYYLEGWKRDIIGAASGAVFRRCEQSMQGHWSNTVTEFEKNILLGATRSRHSNTVSTWFPPPELLAQHGFAEGQWTSDLEHLVIERFNSLQRGETKYRPLSKAEWDYELQDFRSGRLLRKSYVAPRSEVVEAVLADVRAELGGSWNGATLEYISLSLAHS